MICKEPEMRIVEADESYADIIGQVHSKAWRETYENIFPVTYLKQDTSEKRKQEFLYSLNSQGVQYYLIYENDIPVGMAKTEIIDIDVCEIDSIYFLSEYFLLIKTSFCLPTCKFCAHDLSLF